MGTRGGAVFCQAAAWVLAQLPGSLLGSKCRYNVWPLAHPVRDDLVNAALSWVCSCADGPGAPGAHLLALERMVANKPAPLHTILVCAMSTTPDQGTRPEVTLQQDMGGALAGDF